MTRLAYRSARGGFFILGAAIGLVACGTENPPAMEETSEARAELVFEAPQSEQPEPPASQKQLTDTGQTGESAARSEMTSEAEQASGDEAVQPFFVCDESRCIAPGQVFDVTYTRADGTPVTRRVTVDADWGTNLAGDGDYSCMGRCGEGCTAGYGIGCLIHDVCSHEEPSDQVQGSHPDCGDEYDAAVVDFIRGGLCCPAN